MAHAFLPHCGEIWLCRAEGPMVTPMARAPGEPSARRKLSTDGAEFGFLDQLGKRLGHYRILDAEPWFETVEPPLALPKSCRAHDFVIHNGVLIAGGQGRSSEALWVRPRLGVKTWEFVPFPPGIIKRRNRGKTIDALFVRENQLVAVDNMMQPKWILLYPLEPELSDAGVESIRIAPHTTYESISKACEGESVYALYSTGFNHGTESMYISLLNKSSLAEVAVWSGVVEKTVEELLTEVYLDAALADDAYFEEEISILDHFSGTLKRWAEIQKKTQGSVGELLHNTKAMKFCGNHLVLACGNLGLRVNNTAFARTKKGKSRKPSEFAFRQVGLKTITNVTDLEGAFNNPTGIYAVGSNSDGEVSFEWVSRDKLDGLGKPLWLAKNTIDDLRASV